MSETATTSSTLQHLAACRHHAAWTDRSTISVILMTGADRLDLMHRLTTNDVRTIQPGHGRQTVLLTDKARIIDVVTLLNDVDDTMLLASPGASDEILSWVRKYVILDDVRLRDSSNTLDAIEILGPRSGEVAQALIRADVASFATGQWIDIQLDDNQQLRVVRVPSSCEVSFLVIGTHATIDTVREHLVAMGDALPHLDEAQTEYVRVLAGMGKRGNEWTLSFNPLEAGLLHLTSFTKGCYIGQEVVARLDSYNKVKQRIMGLVCPALVSVGDQIRADGTSIGTVTSVVPGLGSSQWFALGYVRGEFAHAGTHVQIEHEGESVVADLVLPPMTDPACQ